jgi:hypothetical protein
MTDKQDTSKAKQAVRAYKRPDILDFGTLQSLTAGGSTMMPEDSSNQNSSRMS